MSSDNLLLTLLGAIGIGALVMSMNKEDEIRENWWGNIQLGSQQEKVMMVNGVPSDISPSDPKTVTSGLQQLQKVGNQQMMQQMSALQAVSIGGQDMKPEVKENFDYQSSYQPSLGSSQVTDHSYVSYPQFNQSITAPSPSLNLPAQIRYNPPSLNNMGITENFQAPRSNSHMSNMSNMDYANVVEGYMSNDASNPSPAPGYAYGNYNNAVKEAAEASKLPIGSMEAGQGPPPENVVMFDRYMIVPGKSAGRFNRSNGVVDRIRGDLPVCVDPCQKGWFQSPGNPSQLTVGALSIIGGSGEQANAITNFTQLYGGNPAVLPSSGRGNPQLQMLSQVAPTNGTVSVSSFQ